MMWKLPRLLLLAVIFACFYGLGSTFTCSSRNFKCRGSNQCVSFQNVCRRGNQCPDGSDEDPEICKMWADSSSHCMQYYGQFIHRGNCYHADQMCSSYPSEINPKICKMIEDGVLDLSVGGMKLTSEIIQTLATAVNASLQPQSPRGSTQCPLLYTRVQDHCIAFFSLAKVPWAEARHFCKSIHGDLIQFKDVTMYYNVLQYMKEAGFTTDYWLGGRFDMDVSAWIWVQDDTPMTLGSPFWAQTYNKTCVPRSLPQSDPFLSPPDALPGAPCYFYTQAPHNRAQGWCAAITWEHFYYMSDLECQEGYSPLCYYTNADD